MHHFAFIIFSFILLSLETTTTVNQLATMGGGDDYGVMNKCFDKERDALLHFKAGLQDPFECLSTWTAEEDNCCEWSGVTCDTQAGHVTNLELISCDLAGEISNSLLNLTYLHHLDLSLNSLNGTIPKFVGSLTQLRYLYLSYNSFYGTIPPEFGNLTNLQELFLGSVGSCSVENLEWLSRLSHLRKLSMNGMSLSKQNHWVDVILSLRYLSYLSLWGCELSHVLYPYFSHLNSSSSIEYLYLTDNNLTSSMYRWLFPLTSNKLGYLDLSLNLLDRIPKYLGNLCNLTSFEFNYNSAVVEFPVFLNNLSGCSSLSLKRLYVWDSQFTGSLPDEIQKFTSLTNLYLSNNQLNGTISEKLWELPNLQTFFVSSNYLRGVVSKNIGKSKLSYIDLSNNSLQGVHSSDHMSNLSFVSYIDLRSCKLGPRFPKWIQNLKKLSVLDISNTGISDTIPLEFWNTWPSHLVFLNLSSNNMSGKVPDLSSNFNTISFIDLSSNRFDGPIPNVSSTVTSLNLSKNNFSGGISFLCQIVGGLLEFLDLSQNFLSGQLPDCLWHFKRLKVLSLGNNNLFGRLPASVESLFKLEVLDLYNNNFSGELPLSLHNCTSLNVLNLGANKFSCNIPIWIGENLSGLYVLILTSNNFFGTIPVQLCELANLQILDLSLNNLHGTIPSCVNSFTTMVQEGSSEYQNQHSFGESFYPSGLYFDHAMIGWQGDEREFFSNLRFLKMIDLSSNNLTGQIPYELTTLNGLVTLNLSKNALLGEIPWKIGEMKNLLVLDISRNKFSGGIPSSMSQMTLLSYLDVSSNNLSGRIPTSTQLQSFNSSRYDGNSGLCGLPLTKKCPRDEKSQVPHAVGERKGDGEDIDELHGWFYIGLGTGFGTGFWIVCGTLLFSRRGRHAFFHFFIA